MRIRRSSAGITGLLILAHVSQSPAQTATEVVLHSFDRDSGAQPDRAPILDAEGNLYGTTTEGGPAYLGSVYKLDTAGNETLLHVFTGEADGGSPAGVILDAAG